MAKPNKKEKVKVKPSKEKGDPLFDVSQETKNSIWGVSAFIVAVISILSFLNSAGTAGEWFNWGAKSLFGWGFFIVPIAFGLLGIAFIKSLSRKIYFSAVFGTLLFILSILAMFYSFGQGDLNQRILQGGYLGLILGYPLLEMTGFVAAMIILAAFLFISFLITLNVPIYQLVEKKQEEVKAVDKVIIKKGNEIVPDKPMVPMPQPIAKPIKAENTPSQEFVIKNLKKGNWVLPPVELLNKDQEEAVTGDINASAQTIKRTLANFGIEVEMGEVSIGPTVTQFTMSPAVGVKLSRITALNPDLSLALAAHPLRIEAPIPGKSLVGIEVPNKKVAVIGLRNLFEVDDFKKSKFAFPMALGRDVSGNPVFSPLEKMPHMLIAGATGTGKSVAINAVLLSMLYRHSPETLKLILVDPKRVELSLYNEIPHLITPVITDTKKVLAALKWTVGEMDRRYETLSKSGSRDIFSYNTKMEEEEQAIMPFIVVVIDELADLMASYGRDVEAAIVRLAQMSRAVGIHLILSTQRPSVEVITGLIKANITTRIALQVASQIDSRTILDMAGAEKLLGKGDMLFVSNDSAKGRRVQGAFVTEKEVKDVVKFWREQAAGREEEPAQNLVVDFNPNSGAPGAPGGGDDDGGDEMYFQAKDLVIQSQQASASYLQRRLGLGYARAARLLDTLEQNGIIGPSKGAKARDIYVKSDGSRLETEMPITASSPEPVYADTPQAERDDV
jgi:S-DNA-T family DNA segregation ATPase FtsK/SpoIIIE